MAFFFTYCGCHSSLTFFCFERETASGMRPQQDRGAIRGWLRLTPQVQCLQDSIKQSKHNSIFCHRKRLSWEGPRTGYKVTRPKISKDMKLPFSIVLIMSTYLQQHSDNASASKNPDRNSQLGLHCVGVFSGQPNPFGCLGPTSLSSYQSSSRWRPEPASHYHDEQSTFRYLCCCFLHTVLE